MEGRSSRRMMPHQNNGNVVVESLSCLHASRAHASVSARRHQPRLAHCHFEPPHWPDWTGLRVPAKFQLHPSEQLTLPCSLFPLFACKSRRDVHTHAQTGHSELLEACATVPIPTAAPSGIYRSAHTSNIRPLVHITTIIPAVWRDLPERCLLQHPANDPRQTSTQATHPSVTPHIHLTPDHRVSLLDIHIPHARFAHSDRPREFRRARIRA